MAYGPAGPSIVPELHSSIKELDRISKQWDLYKTLDGYNVSVLMTDKPKDWLIFRGFDTIEEALNKALEAVRS